MDTGPERITDAEALRRVRAQARWVHAKSLLAAAALTALALLV